VSLIFKRTGFASMAIEHGYTIIPDASVGPEEMMMIVADVPVGWLARLFGDKRVDQTVPLIIPRPYNLQRVYISSGEPIRTGHYKGLNEINNVKGISSVGRLWDQARDALNTLIGCAKG
jgi:1-acyl-sn-glycerol-3-phosphate acyltransferase